MDDTLAIIETEFALDFDSNNDMETNDVKSEQEKTEQKVSKGCQTRAILVNSKQKGNILLKSINNVPWEYDDIVPDYQMGKSVCALFLSMRYHNLNPDYIHERLKLLGKMYQLRILLVLVDIKDYKHCLKHLNRICILANMTLMLAQNSDEAGKIIETYKVYENKPPESLKGKTEDGRYLKIIETLTSVEAVNTTDAQILIDKFGSLAGIINATEYQVSQCPGFGRHKAKKLFTTLHSNFTATKY